MTVRSIRVLLATSLYDFPTDRICAQLDARGVPYARINRETVDELPIVLDPLSGSLRCNLPEWSWTAGPELRAIWWRQPTFQRNLPGVVISLDEQLRRSQWAAFMRSLTALRPTIWVNHPQSTYAAECKPLQLRLAAELGFTVPPTLITNDPNAQLHSLGEPLVVKAVDTVLLHDSEHQYFTYTNIVEPAVLQDTGIQEAPLLCQQLLDPKLDLRVTVIGDKWWAVSVQNCNGAPVTGDWRRLKRQDILIQSYDLPQDVGNLCVQYVHKLGLVYGAIDLAFCRERYFFIEINPTGEWGWLDAPSRPIARAIADQLGGS